MPFRMTAFRLDPLSERLLDELAAHLGERKATVIRMAIRRLAAAELPAPGYPTPEEEGILSPAEIAQARAFRATQHKEK